MNPLTQVLAWLWATGIVATIGSLIALAFFPYVELSLSPVALAFDNAKKESWLVYFREFADQPRRPDGSFAEQIRPGEGDLNIRFYGTIHYANGELSHTLSSVIQKWIARGYWTGSRLSLSYFNPQTGEGIGSYQMMKTPLGNNATVIYWTGYTTSRESNTPDFVVCPAVFIEPHTDQASKSKILKALDKPCAITPYPTPD